MLGRLRETYEDPAFRYAIKFGLAGVLAVFIAEALRLEEPTWALFTIFVLMVAQFVGAIAEKSFFRIVGTIIGAILGYLVTAAFEQQPVIFLPLVGLIVAFCTAMFGQSRYPYGFLLCGMTMTVVVSNGMGNPDFSFQFAFWRVEEVTLGILVALFVQSILWPRYARLEYLKNARSAYGDLRNCFHASFDAIFSGGDIAAARRAEEFPARISALRGLLDFGARESQFFRDHLATYFELTTCLSRIASAISTLSHALPPDSYYANRVKSECDALHKSIEDALTSLADENATREIRAQDRAEMTRCTNRLEKKLTSMRNDPQHFQLSAEDVFVFGVYMLAVDEIRQQIVRSHELIDALPEVGDLSKREPEPFVSPFPPPFWIRSGIKSGIAVVVALVLDNWLQPPGAAMFVLGTWVFTSLNATSPGGRGDCRTFHNVVYSIPVLIGVSLILILIRPMLSSYAVMNTIIFTWLFVWGYLTFSTRGMTIPMQLAMLMIVGILGLNGQEPISFQAIVDYFFGLAFALVVASVIQRLIWPSLPQWELRDRFIELLRLCQQILEKGPATIPLWQKTRVALIPGEAGVRIGHLHPPICPAGEQERLNEYLTILRRVGAQLVVAVGRLAPLLPKDQAESGQERIKRFEAEIDRHLKAHEVGMEQSVAPVVDATELTNLLAAWKQWVVESRIWMLNNKYTSLDIIHFVGLSGRYEEAGRDLLLAREKAKGLRLQDYMGDYVL